MRKSFLIILLCGFFTSCAYTNIQMPMDKNFDRTQLGAKQGKASNYSVLYLVSWGDAGTKASADNGDIKVIKHADRQVYSLLFGLYVKVTTVTYGD